MVFEFILDLGESYSDNICHNDGPSLTFSILKITARGVTQAKQPVAFCLLLAAKMCQVKTIIRP